MYLLIDNNKTQFIRSVLGFVRYRAPLAKYFLLSYNRRMWHI